MERVSLRPASSAGRPRPPRPRLPEWKGRGSRLRLSGRANTRPRAYHTPGRTTRGKSRGRAEPNHAIPPDRGGGVRIVDRLRRPARSTRPDALDDFPRRRLARPAAAVSGRAGVPEGEAYTPTSPRTVPRHRSIRR